MDFGLQGRTAVITGGSMGIGKAVATSLAAEGANLVLIARGEEDLQAASAELGQSGAEVLPLVADLTDPESVDAAAEQAAERFGTINILVNNAGHRMRSMDRQIYWKDEEWLGDVDIKTFGMLRAVRAFHPHLATDGSGRIVNVSGVAGEMIFHTALTHGLNNAAVIQATKYLAADLAPDKITVNTVSPGLVATEWRHGWAEMMAGNQDKSKEEFLADYCRAMGRSR